MRTALVTGAASGIGEGFARHLARRGTSLHLVDRQGEALEALARELQESFAVDVDPWPTDLSRGDDLDALVRRIRRLDGLDLLVNSAGFGAPSAFHALPEGRHLEMLDVHATAVVRTCRAALPGMIRGRGGAIVNVSSIGLFNLIPGNAMYAATKAFVRSLTIALRSEVARHGVEVQLLMPGYTRTGFHRTEAYREGAIEDVPAWLWMSVDQVVGSSLEALAAGRGVCTPGRINQLLGFLLSRGLIPQRVIRRCMR